MDLVSKESIFDIIGWVVVQDDHYYATYHLSYLMVDKALAYYIEDEVTTIKLFNREVEDVPLRLSIFCLQIF